MGLLNWLGKIVSTSASVIHTTTDTEIENGLVTQPDQVEQSSGHKGRGNTFLAQGKLDDAAACYRQAIMVDPRDADAHLNLGFVLNEQQHYGAAEEALRQALAINPALPDAFYILGVMFRARGNPGDAIENFIQAIELKPDFEVIYGDLCQLLLQNGQSNHAKAILGKGIARYPEVADFHAYLGNLYAAENDNDQAIQCFLKALSIQPDHAPVYNNMGLSLQAKGNFDAALECYNKAIFLQPNYAEAYCNLGLVLQSQGKLNEAIASCQKALVLNPVLVAAHNNLGLCLHAQGRLNEAIDCYQTALTLSPDSVEAHNNLGRVLISQSKLEEAVKSCQKAIMLKPDHASAYFNLGNAYQNQGKLDAAIESYQKALLFKPDDADTYSNLGSVFHSLGQYDNALASYAASLQLQPGHAAAHTNESFICLLLGNFELGWQKHEWRWQTNGKKEWRNFKQPLWLGKESLRGKTILLHAEQGLGDTIQFCRYAKLVAAKGAIVVLEIQSGLESLLSGLEGVCQIVVNGEPLPAFDYHCPLLSLPLAFDTRLDTIPVQVPYLASNPARVDVWRARLGEKTNRRVGLVWSGNAAQGNDRNRSIPLNRLVKLVSDQAHFVSLQKEIREGDKLILYGRQDIACFEDDLVDFSETAALISNMDLVISVCTSVAHLAGAMGKPVWLLLAFNADWRWLVDRSDTPWYPSVRLFRQTRIGDWDSVVSTVADEVEAWSRGIVAG